MLFRTLAVLALALYAHVAVAQHPATETRTLQGLRSVSVGFVINVPEGSAVSIDTVDLRLHLELELRRTGIIVSDTARVMLVCEATLLRTPDSLTYAFSYSLRLVEWVTLERRPKAGHVAAVTWERGGVGFADNGSLPKGLSDDLLQLLPKFLNDYLAANPPRR
jgi:hypothetical protein